MFATLQKFGKALMLPIALLPAAGILLGIGGSFSNPTLIAAYHWGAVLSEGSFLLKAFQLMNSVGGAVFANLPLLFALGVAAGMAKRDKGTAVVAAGVAFLLINTTINQVLKFQGVTSDILGDHYTGAMAVKAGLIKKASDFISWKAHFTQTVGIFTLQTSVFGGIISGLLGASLNNKFSQISLPDALAFFGGSRFIPIVTSVASIFVGLILVFLWPFVQQGIGQLGALVNASGLFGTFIFGWIERALIPFGLHHIFYLPFWQTDLGGTLTLASGKSIIGAQNIFFYQLQHPETLKLTGNHFEVLRGTRFMAGKFPFMMFGLWGVAFAMIHTADADKRKETAGLVISAAFTAFLTGITEPLEFSFLFAAPALYYGVHTTLAGLSFVMMHVLNVGVGMTFSGGAIDWTLYGVLQGLDGKKTGYFWVIPVGIVLAIIYYVIFRFAIVKFNLKTPGRGDSKLVSSEEVAAAKYGNQNTTSKSTDESSNHELADQIIVALGGEANIDDVDACITKLRVSVNDKSLVVEDEEWTAKYQAIGIAMGKATSGKGLQIAYGPRADVLKGIINEKLGRD